MTPAMKVLRRLTLVPQAILDLGLKSLTLYGVYLAGLWSGYLRWRTPPTRVAVNAESGISSHFTLQRVLQMPDPDLLADTLGERAGELQTQAEEITAGRARLFGSEPRPLSPPSPLSLEHWTVYARGQRDWGDVDVKMIWEPGRLGWVYPLARAYALTAEARYAETFWSLSRRFLDANPPNLGPQWASAQEVALRLIALVFAFHVFADAPSSTPGRIAWLGNAVADHAARIPPTLVYARAQNNNHLLVEAIGLYTASAVLPAHPAAPSWERLGWRWLNRSLVEQIAEDGTYTQHSTNYHRLMLQAALWAAALARRQGRALPAATRLRLASATQWALARLDPESGQVPNLGPNDGAYIMPLATGPFSDHRPVVGAAGLAFLERRLFAAGPWDELALWLGLQPDRHVSQDTSSLIKHAYPILHNPASNSWATLRAVRFRARPGHADQLHFDLWWGGLNLASDAGSYSYNAPPPWDNSLARTEVHNTVTVDWRDQMKPAGRFLWLAWAQAEITARSQLPNGTGQLVAQHDGYHRLGVLHRRTVTAHNNGHWRITDELISTRPGPCRVHCARLHWLLPDYAWAIREPDPDLQLHLHSPRGEITLTIQVLPAPKQLNDLGVLLVRAGERLHGSGQVRPYWGWVAPTYQLKRPALSLSILVESRLPIKFITRWRLP